MFFFVFSSRRLHTSCALVTGVQTCALPILSVCVFLKAHASPFVRNLHVRRTRQVHFRLLQRPLCEVAGQDRRTDRVFRTHHLRHEIGRASCRERVCQYV